VTVAPEMVRPRCYDIYVEKDKVKGQETGSSFVATSHNRARHIMQSIFSPAARRQDAES
jgi:hypothetical protein